MPQLEFVSQSSRDTAFLGSNTERLVNFYAEPIPEGGMARYALKSVLGTEEWVSLDGVFLRNMANIPAIDSETGAASERLIASLGGDLYEIGGDGSTTALGTVPNCPFTTISGNRGNVTFTCGGEYHVWNGTNLVEPTAGAFSSFGSVDFIGGYTLLTERNGRRLQWSALEDPEDLPGLNFATAEAADENILRGFAINGNWWIFKGRSTEVWAPTGLASEEAFSRLPGAVLETGLKEFRLVTRFPGGAFFVGSDNVCYITAGLDLRPVSRIPIEVAIKRGDATHCLYYEDEGHKFCAVRFRNRPAWVYDLSTGLWHERATGEGAWETTHTAFAYGAWRAGGVTGSIHEMLRNNRDVTGPLVRRAVSLTLQGAGNRFRVPRVEFMGRVGRSDIGRDAKMVLRVSRDGGNTWGAERMRSMGDLGEYDKRMVFRNLGQARALVAELRISDPADLTLLSAANVEAA
jgi:hypothetical protein